MPRERQIPEYEKEAIDDFKNHSTLWQKALDPIRDEKKIVFPEAEAIPSKDHPNWPTVVRPQLKIPIGPLESMFAMYYWYLFLGRHLLQEEVLELGQQVFPGMIDSGSWFDKIIKKPADGCKEVLESLDAENRHHLVLRCDRWFKHYLSLESSTYARTRARCLLGFRGRLEHQDVKLPTLRKRELEYWEGCIHYAVLNSCKTGTDQPTERSEAADIIKDFYHDGSLTSGNNLKGRISNLTDRLDNKKHGDKVAKALVTLYEKHERFWADKAHDIINEYEEESLGRKPEENTGRWLEVPFRYRVLLGLKHSHITMDPSYSGWFSNLIQKEQSSSEGQLTDPRFQQSFVQVAPDDPNKLAPLRSENLPQVRPGPERVRDFAGPSTQASGAGSSYQPHDANALSRHREEVQYIPPRQPLGAGYQHSPQYAYNLARPSTYDPLSAATTSMGNLSVAALAPAPASGQDQGNVKGKRKRQTGDEARKNLPKFQYEQGGNKG